VVSWWHSSGEHPNGKRSPSAKLPTLDWSLPSHTIWRHTKVWVPVGLLTCYLIQAFCSDTTSECSDPISLQVGSVQGEIAKAEATQITLLSIAISDKTSHQHNKPTVGNPPRSSTHQPTILSNAHGPNRIHQMWSGHGLAHVTHGQYTRKSEVWPDSNVVVEVDQVQGCLKKSKSRSINSSSNYIINIDSSQHTWPRRSQKTSWGSDDSVWWVRQNMMEKGVQSKHLYTTFVWSRFLLHSTRTGQLDTI